MFVARGFLWFAAIALGFGLNSLAADAPADGKAQSKPAESALSAEEIAKLVGQLDAPRFADRQAASEKLAEIGKPAIAELAKAAGGESLEATTRAIDLLQKFLESPDDATKQAARAALEQVAKCDRPAAARRAQDALKAAQKTPEGVIQGGGIMIGGMGVVGGAGRRISVRNVNGVKDIDVDEKDKKIKIHDDPQQGITVEVTTKKDGKDVTEKFEGKNAEELKKKHPEAHKLYEEYSGNQGALQFRIQIQPGGAIPLPVQPVPAPNVLPFGNRGLELEIARLRQLSSRLELLLKDNGVKNAPQQTKDEMKKQIDQLKEQLEKLEKRLQEPADPPRPAEKPAEKVLPIPAGPQITL
jgi:hypothetical protein